MSDRHDWNSWDNYYSIHQHCLADFEHFILDDQVTATPTATLVTWGGVLYCSGGIEIHISKSQQVEAHQSGRTMVRTVEYSYNVLRREAGHAVNLFRYDNVHTQPKHADPHHRHRFDAHGAEIEPPEHMGVARWPTLGEVIREAHEWYLAHILPERGG
jgi:hypothetical protein